jgi:hypothetical protein
VQVEETVLGKVKTRLTAKRVSDLSPDKLKAYPGNEYFEQSDWLMFNDGKWVGTYAGLAQSESDAVTAYLEEADSEGYEGVRSDGDTKYAKYQLPGGQNYREVLLTLPVKAEADYSLRESGSGFQVIDPSGKAVVWMPNEAAARAYINTQSAQEHLGGRFVSSHWTQPNVLAHIRVNDRTDADGARVLFVEELQSDWQQSARKQGIQKKLEPVFSLDDQRVRLVRRDEGGKQLTDVYLNDENVQTWKGSVPDDYIISDLNDVIEKRAKIGVPNAPFIDKTDKWLTLSLKRIVKMAVDGGYDRVAFVNGQQSAERFSLDKHLSELRYEPAGEGLYEISGIDHNLVEVISEDNITIDRVEELVGKEMAEKIANGEGEKGTEGGYRDWRSFSGDGLKIEAKGMRAFYDQIVPSATKALLKKLGGGQMEDVRFREDRGFEDSYQRSKGMVIPPITQTGFTITPAMQEKASGGLPLFRRQLAKFSRGAQKQANNAVQSTVDKLTADWQNKPEIVIAFDMQDEAIPDNVRLRIGNSTA